MPGWRSAPVGVLRMVDQGKNDEKILAVAHSDPLYREVKDYSEVFMHTLCEIGTFFCHLQEPGRKKDGNQRMGRSGGSKKDHRGRAMRFN